MLHSANNQHRCDTDKSFLPPVAVQKPAFTAAQPGALVDRRYRVVREIASGGGGTVFEAEHIHTRARVALKTANRTSAVRGARSRLLREGRILGMVHHRNIVPVIDAGECDEYGAFVVLQLIDGRTLESFITGRSKLSVRSTVAVVAQLADALSALAAQRIVHRDVKPANVLVVPGACGRPDTAVLVDFGISCIEDENEPQGGRLTLDGHLVGTPEYMAPEQATGNKAVDHRTDVYGLGVLAYECLTGVTPFSGDPMAVVSSLLVGAELTPITRHRVDVPAQLEAAVRRALHPDPAMRWPDAQSFARACIAATGGEQAPLYLFASQPAAAAPAQGDEARRRTPRAPYRAPARLLWSTGTACDARIEDISSGGLLVATYAALSPDDRICVRLALPLSGRILVAESVVRWVRARGAIRLAGLEYLALPEDARREIELFVKPLD